MSTNWQRQSSVVTISSPWLSMHCERWRDAAGAELDYWRVERPNAVIVIPIHQGQILLPAPMFRPGVGHATLDLPGGRQHPARSPAEMAPLILQRELGVDPAAITRLDPLTAAGWIVNSSFDSQRLFGFVAQLADGAQPPADQTHARYPATPAGIRALLANLECLQCRTVLLEWLIR